MTAGEIDVRVITRHLAALREALQVLSKHSDTLIENLESDPNERWAVERGLHLCAQNSLDIAIHIVASQGRDVPDYTSAIDELGRLGVLPREFVSQFRSVAGFRNVLVHGYLDVDLELLHLLLNERLGDFETFAFHIEAYVQTI
jgi:uncharacterized protein YutE (UPF0331/DUF86 family)